LIFRVLFTITINNIELYETYNVSDYNYYFKKYKIAENKVCPDVLKNKNLGKMFTEFMEVMID
jgi:hypothetical protein